MSPWSRQMTRLLQASGGRGSCLLTLTVLTQAEPGAVGGREKRRPAVCYPQGLRGPAGHWGEGPSDPPPPSVRAQYRAPQDPTVLLCTSTCLTERGGTRNVTRPPLLLGTLLTRTQLAPAPLQCPALRGDQTRHPWSQ